MLFRTALALLDFYGTRTYISFVSVSKKNIVFVVSRYTANNFCRLMPASIVGPALVTTKDAGDAVTLLQSLSGSTFDSSQLVLTARMGYQSVNETILQELSNKHRPSVISAMEERAKGLGAWTDANGLASKLYNFKRDPEPLVSLSDSADQLSDVGDGDANQESDPGNMDDMYGGVTVNSEIDSLPDPKDQVTFSIIVSNFSYLHLKKGCNLWHCHILFLVLGQV